MFDAKVTEDVQSYASNKIYLDLNELAIFIIPIAQQENVVLSPVVLTWTSITSGLE
jgi:hypothetical protein